MNEKRKFPRHVCKIPSKLEYYEGNPDDFDVEEAIPFKGKGIIIDISKGGAFIASNSRVGINMPIKLLFSMEGEQNNIRGTIVRTGLIQNNPSEVARRYAGQKVKGDAYIAVKFDSLLENMPDSI